MTKRFPRFVAFPKLEALKPINSQNDRQGQDSKMTKIDLNLSKFMANQHFLH
jgi:hypothetical protein